MHGLCFAHVLKYNILVCEEGFEDVRNSKLSASSSPLTRMLLIVLANIFLAHDVILAIKVATLFHCRIASNINSIVDETHTLIGCLMLEVIAIHLAIPLNKLDNMKIRIRNLNRICLNMSDRIATLLYLMLEINHEQSTALRHDVVLVTRIVERIVEVRGG